MKALRYILTQMMFSLVCIQCTCSSSGGGSATVKESSAEPSSSPPPAEPSDQDPLQQDPSTITHTPHPEIGEIYTDVKPDKKKKKKTSKETPGTIEHQKAPSGDVHAVSQKKAKKTKGKATL